MSNVSATHHVVLDEDKIQREYPHMFATTVEAKLTLRPERFHAHHPSCDFWRIVHGEIPYWYFKTAADLNLFKEWVECQPHS